MPINTQVVVPAQVKLPSSLSADEIAVLYGYADAAAMVAAIEADSTTPLVKTANYTALTTDRLIICNHASTPFAITLPAATGSGQLLTVKNINAAVVTVAAGGSDTIDGAASGQLAQWDSIDLRDGQSAKWSIT